MTELSIDTKSRAARVRLALSGETRPVEIRIAKYALTRVGPSTRLAVLEASASRQWLTTVLRTFVVGRRLTIPPHAGAALNLLT